MDSNRTDRPNAGDDTMSRARLSLAAFVLALVNHAATAQETVLTSPNGAIECTIALRDGRLHQSIRFRKHPVIEASPLVLTVDGTELTRDVSLGGTNTYAVDETYPSRGDHARAVNRCKGIVRQLKHAASGKALSLELRAFDDAVAFRFIVPGGGSRVPNEATTFVLPAGSTVWFHDLEGHYEGVHKRKAIDEVQSGEWAAPPVTFKLPDGAGYASITEAALVNYSGMALQADGKRGLQVALGHKHPPSYPFRLRYKEDVERFKQPAAISGTITTPWRVVMIGTDLNAMVNCDAIGNLCPPPDPKLFPSGLATTWIKPGRAVWKWLDGGTTTPEGIKEFSRLAVALGFEYNVVEPFWHKWSDADLRDVVTYSNKHGVGIFLWEHSRQLRDPKARAAFFDRCRELGVVGVKIDFFDHDHKEVVDRYPILLREAAEHRLMVDFHGSTKPTGEARTWPNELVRESVRGMEAGKLKARARHDATLPFTRYLAGHADYTPVHFGERRGDTTWAHQIATAVVFTSPLLLYAAHPQKLLDNPCAPMIKSIPTTWDETIVLPFAEIGTVAGFARRKGDVWFVAVVNGPEARTVKVPLSFLAAGDYEGLLVRDRKDDSAAVAIAQSVVHGGDAVAVTLSAGGGFVGRFVKR
jgi:alpha-glucosidase